MAKHSGLLLLGAGIIVYLIAFPKTGTYILEKLTGHG
jgi:hypothetical protein